MTKRDAKRWACGLAAALIRSDLEMGEPLPADDPDYDKKRAAMNELLAELDRRGDMEESADG